jgi:hypothetical protein
MIGFSVAIRQRHESLAMAARKFIFEGKNELASVGRWFFTPQTGSEPTLHARLK